MIKEEVQQRVLQNGKPLDLDKFTWNEETRTFTTQENNLVLDFRVINNINFITGANCVFYTGWVCTFNTGANCTFKTGSYCTFNTFVNCTFDTGSYCIFITGSDCTFNIRDNCVIRARGKAFVTRFTNNTVFIITNLDDINKIYESNDLPKENLLLLTFNNIQKKPLKEVEIIDNFVEVILNKKNKGNIIIRKTIEINDYFNHENFTRYVVSKGEFNAHGETIKKAMKDLEFKILSSKGVEENVKRVLKDNKVTFDDYRLITGSCELGTKDWFDKNNFPYDMEVTVEKAIELVTKTNAYANDIFVEAIEKYKGEGINNETI